MNGAGIVSRTISKWPCRPAGVLRVGYVIGEGIGGEVIPVALDILRAVCDRFGLRLELRQGGLIGTPALKASGSALPREMVDFCKSIFAEDGAVLCGPGGSRFVYELRTELDLYCKFTPLIPLAALRDAALLKPERLDGVDILAVRENSGGLYFGESTLCSEPNGDRQVTHRFGYSVFQVRRILASAFAAARCRRGKLCVTTKPGGIPAISDLWHEQAELLVEEGGVELSFLEIDNAVYQLIANPGAFDVVVSPNMFGDVLADSGSLLLGSRGLSYSGNFGAGGNAVYQTGHGAAHDIAGQDIANPIGQAFSVAMMLRESFGLQEAAETLELAIREVTASGIRTADIASAGSIVVGTKEMGRRIAEAVASVGSS
ncbi:MAG: isocitrate/isopropylmalate family dehydrogenase [Candidatus Nitrotoga sp.]